jgi:glycerophosphoryl diester phosphodiesterase
MENSLQSGPTLIAHRGASERFPENTLIAYQTAIHAGCQHVELDVQLSSDHVPILHHDQDLERITGVAGDITQLSADEVLKRTASYPAKFGTEFVDNRLIKLADFAEVMAVEEQVTFFVEIKRQSVEQFGADLVAGRVLEAISPIYAQSVVISFNAEVLHAVRTKDASIPIGLVLRQYDEEHHEIARSLRPEYLFCKTLRVPEDRRVWPGDWKWALYNTDTVEEALDFYQSGFDLLETNRIVDLLTSPELKPNE